MTHQTKTTNSQTFILLFLSLIAAFGPIVTDLYLPVMPEMIAAFHTNTSSVQLSLTVSILGLASGQLFFGPVSDKYGRKLPLVLSLVLFVVSTLGCVESSTIESFIFFRLIQGFAGAGGIVISRSIAVDLYQGERLARFLSLLAAVQGLAPIIAPLAGGFLTKLTDWRGIFMVLLAIGILILLVSLFYRESLPQAHRLQGSIGQTFGHFLPVLKNKVFMYYTLGLSFAMAAFFAYISASPFIFQSVYHLSPFAYSLFFAVNAAGFILGSQLIRVMKDSKHAANLGSIGLISVVVILAVLLWLEVSIYVVEIFFFLFILFSGIMSPAATALALNLERKAAGNASAVLGFIQYISGSIVTPLVGLGNVNLSTGITLLVCCLLSLYFIQKALKYPVKTIEG